MAKEGASEARNHHFVPQAYLKWFTRNGAKKSKLFVTDIIQKKCFSTIPRNVCAERDFNRVSIPGLDPNIIETSLSDFEGKVANAIQEICESRTFSGESKAIILAFIASLDMRSPFRRAMWEGFENQVFKATMGVCLQNEQTWKYNLKAAGLDGKLSFEDALHGIENDLYKVSVPTERHIELEETGIKTIIPLLHQRKWLLIFSRDPGSQFVTSDSPVLLAFKEPWKIPPFNRYSPGHALKETILQFPLSKTCVLVGEFECENKTIEITNFGTAIVNTRTAMYARRQIFSPAQSFNVLDKEGNEVRSSYLFRYSHRKD